MSYRRVLFRSALSPDGRTLAAGSTAGPILLLRPDSLAVSGRLELAGHTPVNGLAFTPDGRRLVSWAGSQDGSSRTDGASLDGVSVVVWDLAGRKPAGPAFGQAWPDRGGGLLADRSTLLLAQHDRDGAPNTTDAATTVAWNIDARTPSTAYTLPAVPVDAIVVSRDGRVVVLGTDTGPLVLTPTTGDEWRAATKGRPLAVSPDGKSLVLGVGQAVQLVDLATRAVRPGGGAGHEAEVLGAAFAPDGASFATVGADGAVIIWDARAAHSVRTLAGFERPVRSTLFGADGITLYTVGDDGVLLAWDLQGPRGLAARLAATPQSAVALACAVAGRDLSPEEWRRFLPERTYQHVCSA